jgi:CheY-like chemotaxis protein
MTAMPERRRKRIVIVDDSPAYCDLWSNFMLERYPDVAAVETYSHPYDALPKIDASIDLLIVDLEMPGMDGKKFVEYARQKGLSARRIVVTSSHSADELHQRFRIGETIAVINKTEARQQEAFLMILDSVMRRQGESPA